MVSTKKTDVRRRGRSELFGEVAVRMGFVKSRDIQAALKIQQELKEKGRKHKLIGLILLDMGVLDISGLISVLKEMEAQKELKPTKERVS